MSVIEQHYSPQAPPPSQDHHLHAKAPQCWICLQRIREEEDQLPVCACENEDLNSAHGECIKHWVLVSHCTRCRFCKQPYKVRSTLADTLIKGWECVQNFITVISEFNLETGTRWDSNDTLHQWDSNENLHTF